MRYRRGDVSGAASFVTVNLAEWNRTLLVYYVAVLRAVMKEIERPHPFHIDAMVDLPDHLHAVWTLPVGDCVYRTRWTLMKAGPFTGRERSDVFVHGESGGR